MLKASGSSVVQVGKFFCNSDNPAVGLLSLVLKSAEGRSAARCCGGTCFKEAPKDVRR